MVKFKPRKTMTKKEKLKLYRSLSKKELAKMLYAATEQLNAAGMKITFTNEGVDVNKTVCIKLTPKELERLVQQWWVFPNYYSNNCYIEIENPEEK